MPSINVCLWRKANRTNIFLAQENRLLRSQGFFQRAPILEISAATHHPPPPSVFTYIFGRLPHSPNADFHAPTLTPLPMNGHQALRSSCNLKTRSSNPKSTSNGFSLPSSVGGRRDPAEMKQKKKTRDGLWSNPSFTSWSVDDAVGLVRFHPIPCMFAASLLFFMGVEYTLRMVPPSSPPFDLGFVATEWLHRVLASSPDLNTLLAGLNTVGARFHHFNADIVGFRDLGLDLNLTGNYLLIWFRVSRCSWGCRRRISSGRGWWKGGHAPPFQRFSCSLAEGFSVSPHSFRFLRSIFCPFFFFLGSRYSVFSLSPTKTLQFSFRTKLDEKPKKWGFVRSWKWKFWWTVHVSFFHFQHGDKPFPKALLKFEATNVCRTFWKLLVTFNMVSNRYTKIRIALSLSVFIWYS